MKKRVRIFVGAYGSGKTEVSINYTFGLRASGVDTAIADLDLVNPYFRSRELKQQFEAEGIVVVAPAGELANADLPVITPMVRSLLREAGQIIVLDVGGDDAGSRALSQFSVDITEAGYEMYMVVNDRRPFTSDVNGIKAAIQRVEANSRLQVSALISNPNLAHETTSEVVQKGHGLVLEAGRQLDLPVAYLCVMESLLPSLPVGFGGDIPVMKLHRHLLPPWYEDPLRFAPYQDRRAQVMAQEIANRRAQEEGS